MPNPKRKKKQRTNASAKIPAKRKSAQVTKAGRKTIGAIDTEREMIKDRLADADLKRHRLIERLHKSLQGDWPINQWPKGKAVDPQPGGGWPPGPWPKTALERTGTTAALKQELAEVELHGQALAYTLDRLSPKLVDPKRRGKRAKGD